MDRDKRWERVQREVGTALEQSGQRAAMAVEEHLEHVRTANDANAADHREGD